MQDSKMQIFGDLLIGIIEFSDKTPEEEAQTLNQDEIFSDASQFNDVNLGSFERCAHILTLCRGDREEARKILDFIRTKELLQKD